MSFGLAPFSVVHWLSSSVVRAVEAPGAWITNFVDTAEDVWDTDPLLSDDDEFV